MPMMLLSTLAWSGIWSGGPSCYLETWWQKLKKQICKAIDPLLAACLGPLAHCQNLESLILFCRNYFGRYLYNIFLIFDARAPSRNKMFLSLLLAKVFKNSGEGKVTTMHRSKTYWFSYLNLTKSFCLLDQL